MAAAREEDVQAALAGKVSRERVTMELDKILKAAGSVPPIVAFRQLWSMNLLGLVFFPPQGAFLASPAAEGAPDVLAAAGSNTNNAAPELPVDKAADERLRAKFEPECMACLEAVHTVMHAPDAGWGEAQGGGAGEREGTAVLPMPSARDAQRLAWLGAATLPLRHLHAPLGKKGKLVPLADAMLRTGLPGLGAADIAAVVRAHVCVPAMAAWLADKHIPPKLTRLELGLRLREAGAVWQPTLALALVAAAPPLDVEHAMPRGQDISRTRVDDAKRAWLASARAQVQAATAVAQRVEELGLADVHALRPALSGADLMKQAGVPKGPAVGRATQALLEYQLEHPDASQEDMVVHINGIDWTSVIAK